MKQGELFDGRTIGAVLRDEAIDAVEAPRLDWVDSVAQIIESLYPGYRFTTDDLWDLCETEPDEPRAMGAAVMRCKRAGIIEPTGRWTKSTRPANHARDVRQWVRVVRP